MRREPVLNEDGARTLYINPLMPDSSVMRSTARHAVRQRVRTRTAYVAGWWPARETTVAHRVLATRPPADREVM